ncbi:MAG: hypothetical protein ACP5GJ_00950 [Nanopusillaceae archaeon]
MKSQAEIIYTILFLALIIIVILLTFYSLSFQYKQNQVFVRYTSSITLSNYFLGYLYTSLIQQGYSSSYLAGVTSWNDTFWASVPEGCNLPPSCQQALNYYNNLLTINYESVISYGLTNLQALNFYYPYSITVNFTNNYNASIIGNCSEINSGEYNYYFPIQANGLTIITTSNSSGSYIPFNISVNITNNPAFYLYNLSYSFSISGVFSQCSLQDCINALEGKSPQNTCAQIFEQMSNNPYIKCNESITKYQCDLPYATCNTVCQYPQGIACIIGLYCEDTQYNVYFLGKTKPQSIYISSVVYYQNVTQYAYKICEYQCEYQINTTNNEIITPLPLTCNLTNAQNSCNSQEGCGTSQIISKENNTKTIEFTYYESIPAQCYVCWINVQCGCNLNCAEGVICPSQIQVNTYCNQ